MIVVIDVQISRGGVGDAALPEQYSRERRLPAGALTTTKGSRHDRGPTERLRRSQLCRVSSCSRLPDSRNRRNRLLLGALRMGRGLGEYRIGIERTTSLERKTTERDEGCGRRYECAPSEQCASHITQQTVGGRVPSRLTQFHPARPAGDMPEHVFR